MAGLFSLRFNFDSYTSKKGSVIRDKYPLIPVRRSTFLLDGDKVSFVRSLQRKRTRFQIHWIVNSKKKKKEKKTRVFHARVRRVEISPGLVAQPSRNSVVRARRSETEY